MAQNSRSAQLKPDKSRDRLESTYAQRLSWLEQHGNRELRKLYSAQPPRWGSNSDRSRPSLLLLKLVYRVIVSRAVICGTVQETQQQLAESIDESAVQTRSAMRYLQHLGLLECVQRANSGGRKSGGSARPAVYAVTALQKYLAEHSEELEDTTPLDQLEARQELSTEPKESGYSCEYFHSSETGSEKKNEGTQEPNEGTPESTSPRFSPRFNSSAAIFADNSSAAEPDEKSETMNEQNSDSDSLQTGSEALRVTEQLSSSDQAPDSTQELTGTHSASQEERSRAVFDEYWNALEERTLERIMREAGKKIFDPKAYKKELRKDHAQRLRAARSTGWDRWRYVSVVRTELEDWLTAQLKQERISPALWQRLEELEREARAELYPPQPAAAQMTDQAWAETRDLALILLGCHPEDTPQRIKILMARGAELEQARALISARWIHVEAAHPALVEFVRRTAASEEIPTAFLDRLDRLQAEQLSSVTA